MSKLGRGAGIMINKNGGFLQKSIISIVLVMTVFALLLVFISHRSESLGFKQQFLEKQMALIIDSGIPGTVFYLNKLSSDVLIDDVSIRDGRIFIKISGFSSLTGYPYLTPYLVTAEDIGNKWRISLS
jgi:hypothetical protein